MALGGRLVENVNAGLGPDSDCSTVLGVLKEEWDASRDFPGEVGVLAAVPAPQEISPSRIYEG